MGLIQFVKDAGARLQGALGRDDEAGRQADAERHASNRTREEQQDRNAKIAAGLAAAVRGFDLGIEDLEVAFDGARAQVRGTAATQADREKAVLVIGNHRFVAEVDDRIEVDAEEAPAIYRTVEEGDTLGAIASEQYGVMRLYDRLFEANRPMLEDPDAIYPGQVLRVPRVSAPEHAVQAGETLGGIAKHWYGDPARYEDIFEANRDLLDDPDRIEVGQVLRIPAVGPAVIDAGAAA